MFQEGTIWGQRAQQLKHNWLDAKQIISGMWLLSKKKTKTKETPTSCFIRNTGTGKQNTVHKAQLKRYGYISEGKINRVFTHTTD